ncbi:MAG TPA: DUF4124 domain-containing protein [Geobacteraceae bacterium]|nr:DUF4124 domain-containing protein [Geobacteraceae bacterium]
MKPILLLVTLLLVLITPAYGQLYEWTDDSGSVNFSDDPEHIPAKYRSRAKTRESTTGETAEKGETRKEKSPVQAAPSTRSAPELYGGRTLSWWQESYAAKSKRLQALQARLAKLKDEQITARRKKLTLQRAMDRTALNAKMEEVTAMEAQVTDMEKEMAEFKSLAESSGLTADMLGSGSR